MNTKETGKEATSTLFLHGVCMLRECIYGECAHEQHVRRTLTLTHMITAYSISGNVVRVHILICATRQSEKKSLPRDYMPVLMFFHLCLRLRLIIG